MWKRADTRMGVVAEILAGLSNPSEIETAFNNLALTRLYALLVGPGPFLDGRRDLLVACAAKIAIPAAYETCASAEGGLVSYGADVGDAYRQAGVYAGPCPEKSEKPADLPVVRATRLSS